MMITITYDQIERVHVNLTEYGWISLDVTNRLIGSLDLASSALWNVCCGW